MSEIKVNKISPRTACGTTTLGDSGDTFTIPSGVSITNQGTASGFGSTGEVSWVTTKKTSTFTVTSGEGYFCDTSSGGFTVNLPAGTAGNSFAVADYTNTFQTGNLTISPNGSQKIGGVDQDAVLSTEGQSAYFVYVDDTEGWKNVIDSTSNVTGLPPFIVATGGTITTSGNCKIHTFTGPGTFSVSGVSACAANNVVSHLVVAGGGGGGWDRAGGGGAGGFREVKSPVTPYTASPLDGYPSAPNRVTVTASSFPITVGAGGTGGLDNSIPQFKGASGSNSIFSTITSAGGGGGGAAPCSQTPGINGGSGGGTAGPSSTAGSGNTPPVSPSQGFPGGISPAAGGGDHGAGGGGATAAGGPGAGSLNPGTASAGGAGATTSINGTPTARAGGGGGGFSDGAPGCSPFPGGSGGAGGGGTGGSYPGGQGNAGTVNTGGGGGGGSNGPNTSPAANGGAGGSGIVIIRYRFQ